MAVAVIIMVSAITVSVNMLPAPSGTSPSFTVLGVLFSPSGGGNYSFIVNLTPDAKVSVSGWEAYIHEGGSVYSVPMSQVVPSGVVDAGQTIEISSASLSLPTVSGFSNVSIDFGHNGRVVWSSPVFQVVQYIPVIANSYYKPVSKNEFMFSAGVFFQGSPSVSVYINLAQFGLGQEEMGGGVNGVYQYVSAMPANVSGYYEIIAYSGSLSTSEWFPFSDVNNSVVSSSTENATLKQDLEVLINNPAFGAVDMQVSGISTEYYNNTSLYVQPGVYVNMTPVPYPGYRFIGWLYTTPPFTMPNASVVVEAVFESSYSITILLESNDPGAKFLYNGVVYPSNSILKVNAGSAVPLSVQVPWPFQFVDWAANSTYNASSTSQSILFEAVRNGTQYVYAGPADVTIFVTSNQTVGGYTFNGTVGYYGETFRVQYGSAVTIDTDPVYLYSVYITGSVSGSPDVSFSADGNYTEFITYEFVGVRIYFNETGLSPGYTWSVTLSSSTNSSSSSSIEFLEPAGNYTYSVHIAGNQYTRFLPSPSSGTVSSPGPGHVTVSVTFSEQFLLDVVVDGNGTASPSGQVWEDSGSTVLISATPEQGNHFVGWVGEGSVSYTGRLPQATVVMDSPVNETAYFSVDVFNIWFNETGLPSGTVWSMSANGNSYDTGGTSIQLREDYGTVLSYIVNSIDNVTQSGVAYYPQPESGSLTVTQNYTVDIQFVTAYWLAMGNSYQGAGRLSPGSGWHVAGTVVSISAQPSQDDYFLRWAGTGTGSYSGPDNPAAITMDSPITEEAYYGVIVVFQVSGMNSFSTGDVVVINGTPYTYSQFPVDVKATVGTVISYSWYSPVQGSGARFWWQGASGLAAMQSGFFEVTSPGYVNATYRGEYLVTASPSNYTEYIWAYQNGSVAGPFQGSAWIFAGSQVYVSSQFAVDGYSYMSSGVVQSTRLVNQYLDYGGQTYSGYPDWWFSDLQGNFVGVFYGWFTAPVTGTYSFQTTSDDGSALWISQSPSMLPTSSPLVNNWYQQGATSRSGTVDLTGGTTYYIIVDYEQGNGGYALNLQWELPGSYSYSEVPVTGTFYIYDAPFPSPSTSTVYSPPATGNPETEQFYDPVFWSTQNLSQPESVAPSWSPVWYYVTAIGGYNTGWTSVFSGRAWRAQGATYYSETVSVSPGYYTVVVDYVNQGGPGVSALSITGAYPVSLFNATAWVYKTSGMPPYSDLNASNPMDPAGFADGDFTPSGSAVFPSAYSYGTPSYQGRYYLGMDTVAFPSSVGVLNNNNPSQSPGYTAYAVFRFSSSVTFQIYADDGMEIFYSPLVGLNISGSGWYQYGQRVSISAPSVSGLIFRQWIGQGPGSYTGVLNSSSITVQGPVWEVAYYANKVYTVKVTIVIKGLVYRGFSDSVVGSVQYYNTTNSSLYSGTYSVDTSMSSEMTFEFSFTAIGSETLYFKYFYQEYWTRVGRYYRIYEIPLYIQSVYVNGAEVFSGSQGSLKISFNVNSATTVDANLGY